MGSSVQDQPAADGRTSQPEPVICSSPTVRAWLLELAGAVVLAIAGITLWALPPDTPVIGRPPTGYGWLCIAVAVLIALLSTANYFGLEFEQPIKRRTVVKISNRVLPASPVPTAAPAPVPITQPLPVPARPGRPREPYSDATIDGLMELAKTPNLTAIQLDGLLAPYKGKWMAIQGVVTDVEKPVGVGEVRVSLSKVNGDDQVTANAWFVTGQERAAALHRGANVHVLGKLRSVFGIGLISFDECELTD